MSLWLHVPMFGVLEGACMRMVAMLKSRCASIVTYGPVCFHVGCFIWGYVCPWGGTITGWCSRIPIRLVCHIHPLQMCGQDLGPFTILASSRATTQGVYCKHPKPGFIQTGFSLQQPWLRSFPKHGRPHLLLSCGAQHCHGPLHNQGWTQNLRVRGCAANMALAAFKVLGIHVPHTRCMRQASCHTEGLSMLVCLASLVQPQRAHQHAYGHGSGYRLMAGHW